MIPVPISQPKQIPIGQHFTRLVPLRTRVAAIGQNSGPSLLALAALRPRAIGRRFANTKAGARMQRSITTSKTASFRARTMATRRKAGRIRVPLRRPRRRQFPRRHPPRHRQPLRYTSHPPARALRQERRGPLSPRKSAARMVRHTSTTKTTQSMANASRTRSIRCQGASCLSTPAHVNARTATRILLSGAWWRVKLLLCDAGN